MKRIMKEFYAEVNGVKLRGFMQLPASMKLKYESEAALYVAEQIHADRIQAEKMIKRLEGVE